MKRCDGVVFTALLRAMELWAIDQNWMVYYSKVREDKTSGSYHEPSAG